MSIQTYGGGMLSPIEVTEVAGMTQEQLDTMTALVQLVNTKANQQYVIDQISAIVGSAPGALDTLAEIAAQLGNDETAINALMNAVAGALRFDIAQSLTSGQKTQALGNIGAEAVGVAAGLVATETTARLDADTSLQSSINANATAISTESTARASADGALSARLDPVESKLAGIASEATANSTDAQLRDRSTHTGKQAINTVDGLQTTLDNKLNASAYINRFKGKFISLSALQTALPTSADGDYAVVDAGAGANAMQYIWDAEAGWVPSVDGVSISTTDQLVEGSSNRYFNEARTRNSVLTGLSLATATAVAATDSILVAIGKVQAQVTQIGATNPVTLIIAGIKIAAFKSLSGEQFHLQNSMSQHMVRGMYAAGSTTLASLNLMGTSDYVTQGTASVATRSNTNRWLPLPRVKYLNTAFGYIVFGRCITPSCYINQTASLQFDAINSTAFSVSETNLFSGARMFCGDRLGSAAPTDAPPEQMTDFIGVIQSPFFTANPNRLYFAVNGNGVVATVYDTGIDVALGIGYQVSIFYARNMRTVGIQLKNINTGVAVERIIDLSALAISAQPATGAYYSQVWRSCAGNINANMVGIDFCRYYNELGN